MGQANSDYEDAKDMMGGGEGGADKRYIKLREGKNLLRITRNSDPDSPFFRMWGMHYLGEDDDRVSFRCIEPGGPFGHSKKKDKQRGYKAKKCPTCIVYCKNKSKARRFPWKSKEGIKFWRSHVAPYRAKLRFVMAAMLVKKKPRAKVLEQPLIEAFYDENMGGDFTDPKRGRNILIVKTKLGSNPNEVEYKTNIVPDRSLCKGWKKIRKKLPVLDSFVPEELEPKAILALMEGDGTNDDERPRKGKKSAKGRFRSRDDGDSDLDDVDDGDDEDDDEDKESRRHKLARRKRGRDEDVDPDAAEVDDEEPKKKKKKKGKKSKMRDKLSKKARRE
jgi:hypothetical protein